MREMLLQRLGLGSQDIRIRVNNRKVLQAVAQQNSIPDDQFSAVCVILDKLEKIPEEEVRPQPAPPLLAALITALITPARALLHGCRRTCRHARRGAAQSRSLPCLANFTAAARLAEARPCGHAALESSSA